MANFAHHFVGNFGLGAAELQSVEISPAFTQGEVAYIKDTAGLGALAQAHKSSFGAQAGTRAGGARALTAQAAQVFTHQGGVGFAPAPLHVGDDALKHVFFAHFTTRLRSRLHGVAELYELFSRAKQQHVLNLWAQALKRRFYVKAVVLGQALQHHKVVGVPPVPAFNGAAGQTQTRKRHHPRRVKKGLLPQAIAAGAGPLRRVE